MVPKVNDGDSPVIPELAACCVALWADGGCIQSNPSPLGGTWAFLFEAGDGTRFLTRCGYVLPEQIELPTVSNNVTELLAILLGLEALPDAWSGPVYSDSLNALRRVGNPRVAKMAGVPAWMVERTRAVVDRLGELSMILVGGHPTRAELAKGERADGKPCHAFNVECDRLCNEEAARWALERG